MELSSPGFKDCLDELHVHEMKDDDKLQNKELRKRSNDTLQTDQLEVTESFEIIVTENSSPISEHSIEKKIKKLVGQTIPEHYEIDSFTTHLNPSLTEDSSGENGSLIEKGSCVAPAIQLLGDYDVSEGHCYSPNGSNPDISNTGCFDVTKNIQLEHSDATQNIKNECVKRQSCDLEQNHSNGPHPKNLQSELKSKSCDVHNNIEENNCQSTQSLSDPPASVETSMIQASNLEDKQEFCKLQETSDINSSCCFQGNYRDISDNPINEQKDLSQSKNPTDKQKDLSQSKNLIKENDPSEPVKGLDTSYDQADGKVQRSQSSSSTYCDSRIVNECAENHERILAKDQSDIDKSTETANINSLPDYLEQLDPVIDHTNSSSLSSDTVYSDHQKLENCLSGSVSNELPPIQGTSSNQKQVPILPPALPPTQKSYDYLLKFLLVGDSDVGKQEIISDMEDGTTDSPFCSSSGAGFKTTIILIDGKRVKLQLWDTSGQGRFCTIIRSYSRGAQGILLVYDITNKWSFEGINRWLKEVDQHAPGIPKVLVGNRLHLAFKRQVHQEEAEEYAERNSMGFFEVSPLVNFNISETLVELARMALRRNGMERWNGKSNKVSTLYELCAHSIVNRTTVYGIDRLKLPTSVKQNLKSYAVTNYSISQTNKKFLRRPGSSSQYYPSGSFKNRQSGGSPASSICNSLRRVHRNRQHTPLANTPADAANINCGPSRKSCTIS